MIKFTSLFPSNFQVQEKPKENPSSPAAASAAPSAGADPELAAKLSEWEEHFCCPICMERKKVKSGSLYFS